MSRLCRHAVLAASAAVAALAPMTARADIYVNGGGDDIVQPALAAELAIVYAGQHFTAATIDSAAVFEGFSLNDCTFDVLPNCSWSPLGGSTTIDFGVSVIPLTSAQIQTYNNNLGASSGPLLQFPLYAVPLAIVDQEDGITQNGQLVLDDGALCGIFSGQLTDWSQFSYTVPAGGFSIVYDTDPGSGATWLLTQHLNAVCNGSNSTFTKLPVPITSDFATLPVPGGVANNSRFIGAAGSLAMQAALLAGSSTLGYIGPSYTAVAPMSPATAPLYVAGLYNPQNHGTYLPVATAAALAMHNFGPGAANTVPPATKAIAADPTAWVPTNPQPSEGYIISGFANWILSSCYSSVGPFMLQYLSKPYNKTQHQAVVANAGLATAGSAFGALIMDVYVNLLQNHNNYGLNLQNPLTCLAYHGR